MRSEWELLWRLGLALVLSTVIGLEREWRQKSPACAPTRWSGSGRRCSCSSPSTWASRRATPVLARRLPRSGLAPSRLQLSYLDGLGVLREVLSRITAAGFDVSDLSFQRTREEDGGDPRAVAVQVEVRGRYALTELVSELGELDGVLTVHAADANADPD